MRHILPNGRIGTGKTEPAKRLRRLQRLVAALVRSYPHGVRDGVDEDLAVADFAGAGGIADGFDDPLYVFIFRHDLDDGLGEEFQFISLAAELLSDAPLRSL